MPIQRIYVVKRAPHDVASVGLKKSLKEDLGIAAIETLKILNRYDIECPDTQKLTPSLNTVFAENMVDDLFIEKYPFPSDAVYFAAEYLPGQYDQRSDSAEQCVKVMTGDDSVKVASAKVYVITGKISANELDAIKSYIINKIDQREASLEKPETLAIKTPEIKPVEIVKGFIQKDDTALLAMLSEWGLAMNLADLKFCQDYFKNEEKRDPTETEIKLLDTYWSDHCRHTTFNTVLTDVKIEDGKYKAILESALKDYLAMRQEVYGEKLNNKPVSLMDAAIVGAKYAHKNGLLENLEISDENNACSIEIDVDIVGGKPEKWLLQFKNETHNHPTEIEPFGGAATCLGGAIRDPLSGRAYVYHSMRITGAADPRKSISETLEGKLPQYKICKEAAQGFSSYGNQIGLATGYVQEYYHDGFIAKRMETGAVMGAVPKAQVRREAPAASDKVILIGGRTGRDGIGGATGSSKEHDVSSIELCGAEVQKGNAPEEHKIQRLFRKAEVSEMIKKCNDFGAGGVGVAIGELSDGLLIDLDKVPKKYSGLTGTEIAISESQERMAAVVAAPDAENFIAECMKENLEATIVAEVTDKNRLQMKHGSRLVVDISRKFLDSAGAERKQSVIVTNPGNDGYFKSTEYKTLKEAAEKTLSSLNACSQKGLVEMFDSTVGAGSVITPFGGVTANTPAEYMAAKIPVQGKDTTTVSLMAAGYNPYLSSWSCFHAGLYAVIESVAKLIAAGAHLNDIRLSFQEYFERLGTDDKRWGKPFSALLGTLKAQKELGLAAIGGKDSMSGTFKDKTTGNEINVPPTLISFAVAPSDLGRVVTQEFKKVNCGLWVIKTNIDKNGMLDMKQFIENAETVSKLIGKSKIKSIYTVKQGGIIESLAKAAFGNMTGANLDDSLTLADITFPYYGSFIVQTDEKDIKNAIKIGETTPEPVISYKNEKIELAELLSAWQTPLEHVFPSKTSGAKEIINTRDYVNRPRNAHAGYSIKPYVAILALPGTNCEYDLKRAFELAGSRETDPFVFRNMTAQDAQESCAEFAKRIRNSQIVAIPGGFSAGDEPEGSGKFYVSVIKNPLVQEAINDLLHKRGGLMIGICNGFQALVKTGLLTYGEIRELDKNDATLTFNKIGRHVSQMVRTRVSSVNSPWLALRNIGDIDIVPVSHGEGRFTAPKSLIDKMFTHGQVAFQYVDTDGNITMESPYNPNASDCAIEGITSPDGRILGKMAHSERVGNGVHKNSAYGNMEQMIFKAGVDYFK